MKNKNIPKEAKNSQVEKLKKRINRLEKTIKELKTNIKTLESYKYITSKYIKKELKDIHIEDIIEGVNNNEDLNELSTLECPKCCSKSLKTIDLGFILIKKCEDCNYEERFKK